MAQALTDRLASLYKIGQIITSSLVLGEVLDRVLDSLIENIGAERAAIMLLNDRGDLVVKAARTSDHKPVTTDFFEFSRHIVRDVARTGTSRLIGDAAGDSSYQAFGSVVIHQLRSVLCVPLKYRDRVRGVLYADHRVQTGTFGDEELVLLSAFADQAAIAIENARLYEELGQRERMRRELEIARAIQASLMPRRLPAPEGFELAGACVPARDVGGDFYDGMTTPDGRVVLFLGDVSGKGVPAALLMGMVRTLLRSEVQRLTSLVEAVRHCNRVLYTDFTNTNMFATLFLGILDPRASTVSYLNCGHCEPLLWRGASGAIESLGGDGLPLGILDDFEVSERTVKLERGDVLLAYSDGFSEAKAASGEMFGVPRLTDALRASVHRDADGILDDIGGAVDRFVQTESQSDDQTIMVIRVASP